MHEFIICITGLLMAYVSYLYGFRKGYHRGAEVGFVIGCGGRGYVERNISDSEIELGE